MTLAHYWISELDSANHVVERYAVICRSDAAALTMASKGAENRATVVEVWESSRHVARFELVTTWHRRRSQWTGQSIGDRLRVWS